MGLGDLAAAPLLLTDVFDALDELSAQAAAHKAATAPSDATQRPGVLR